MVTWITGKAGAGKSTLAREMIQRYKREDKPAVWLDGETLRTIQDNDFSDEGRRSNVMFAAKLAAVLEGQGFYVVVSMVSPYDKVREEAFKLLHHVVVVYVKGGKLWPGTTYEEPDGKRGFVYDWRE